MGLSVVKKSIWEGRPSWLTALTLWWLFLPFANAGTVATLDDIQFWVGSGANRAAMVIDWDDSSAADESLVWGYRWDGTATGEDMLLELLTSDIRLFAKLSTPSASGISLFGLGYDDNNDCQFAISDGTTFNADGFAFSGPPDNPPPAATATNPNDLYSEGWFTGYWNYGLSSGNPFDGGSWASSGSGMSNRMLSDGDWDSWTFTSTFNFTAFAENPVAAELAGPGADFDLDNDVDGADFLAWQQGFGILSGATHVQGDTDCNQMVDGNDLQLWADGFGVTAAVGVAGFAGATVPEPCSIGLLLLGSGLVLVNAGRRRQ
ncbi:MAG: hypothetical protein GXP26_03555 [Planctomycetes bacterium]|nr:hypothetical protein [Planctomycetota bacterium]